MVYLSSLFKRYAVQYFKINYLVFMSVGVLMRDTNEPNVNMLENDEIIK